MIWLTIYIYFVLETNVGGALPNNVAYQVNVSNFNEYSSSRIYFTTYSFEFVDLMKYLFHIVRQNHNLVNYR